MESVAKAEKVGAPSLHSATASIASALLALSCLCALHVLSPELSPSWRMVSEYCNGHYGWVLSLMFLAWAISTWALAIAAWPEMRSVPSKIGAALLLMVGVGESLAAFYDANQPLHGLAVALGVLPLPIAALLVGVQLSRKPQAPRGRILLLSQLPWLTLVLMVVSMVVLIKTATAAGIQMGPGAPPISELPNSVVAFNGWINRLLITAYLAWAIGVAQFLQRSRR